MSITGLLPASPRNRIPFLNPIPCRLSSSPSTFKIDARGASISGIQHLPVPNGRHPGSHLCSIPLNTNGCINSSVQVAESAIDECFSLLDRIKANSSCTSSSSCRQVHGRLAKLGALKGDGFIANKLVIAYSRNTELLNDARKLFDEIPKREVPAYAALIGALCRLERWVDLFCTVGMLVNDGMLPDKYLLPTILKACSMMERVEVGKMVHGHAVRKGMDEDVFVLNALIDMYANCGNLRYSERVFDAMNERDVVSWTALIVAYSTHGLLDEAIDAFSRMELDGIKADLISWNALVSAFARNGEIDLALQSLEEMQETGLRPKVNTWNGIISGCIQNEHYQDALDAFVKMFWTSLVPNVVTFVSILPACAGLEDLNLGKVIHGRSIKLGLSGNTHVEGSLIDMYWKCGRIDYAESIFVRVNQKSTAIWNEMIAAYMNEGNVGAGMKLFNSMKHAGPKPDVITYNTILAAYARDGKKNEAYELLIEMFEVGLRANVVTFNILISGYQQSGLSHEALKLFHTVQSPCSDSFVSQLMRKLLPPDPVAVNSALAACADLGLSRQGKELHGHVVRNNLESNVYVSSALIDMYSKCGDMDSAAEVFWRTENGNTVMLNALMAGYINKRKPYEAFDLFNMLLNEGLKPSPVTFMILMPACGEIRALALGRELHGCLLKCQFDESSIHLGSGLIDMYAKCGCIREAKQVFDSQSVKDVALWNSMISSFSSHGMTENALDLFAQMQMSGGVPDGKTFIALLSACAQSGLVDKGWNYFTLMEHTYGIAPTLEHYTCMVGILGSAGLLDEAVEFIKKMPFTPDACLWATLLRSCRSHSN